MIETVINCERPAEADVVFIGAPYDRTSSFGKGADRGPAAIHECVANQLELYDRFSNSAPALERRIAWVDVEGLQSLEPEAMVDRLHEAYLRHDGAFRLLVGGEHSVSNAALRAWAARAEEITVLQIDAHADLRQDDSDYNERPWGRYAHCSVMRRAHEQGFPLVQAGIRAYSAEERALFDEPGIRVFEWGPNPPDVDQIVDAIATDEVYLTVDADGIDPAFMPATGTPVQGGLDWYYTFELLQALAAAKRIVAADLVEVCPRRGEMRTEYGAAQLLYSLIGFAAPRRG